MTAAPIPSLATFPSRAAPFSGQTFLRNPSFPQPLIHSISRRCRTHCCSSSSGSIDAAEKLGLVKEGIEKVKEVKSEGDEGEEEVWDWERWVKHFEEVEEDERMLEELKAQLARAVDKEDYEDADRLKVAIAAVTEKDIVGHVISQLKSAIDQERYKDVAFLKDDAGVGLVGWWSGISDDSTDPYGYIIRISAERGRYIARSFSVRQLDTATPGSPLFEIFLTRNKKGEYKHQAVYLKRKDVANLKASDSLDATDDPFEFLRFLQKQVSGDTDRNIKHRNNEQNEVEIHSDNGIVVTGDASGKKIDVVIGGPRNKSVTAQSSKDLLRVPAKLIKGGHNCFSFTIENANEKSSGQDKTSKRRNANRRVLRRGEEVMSELVMVRHSGKKMPKKLVEDFLALVSSSLNQAHDSPLLGSTTFNRIELPAFPDPLNGLYITCHAPFAAEVIQLRHKYGQWQEELGSEAPSNLELYEYVEAVKLTGDTYLPAGQVVFRAKVGRGYELPPEGVDMRKEKYTVLCRYKAQERLATPGSDAPSWADGELHVLDRKYPNQGPVIRFVGPGKQLKMFFEWLKLEE